MSNKDDISRRNSRPSILSDSPDSDPTNPVSPVVKISLKEIVRALTQMETATVSVGNRFREIRERIIIRGEFMDNDRVEMGTVSRGWADQITSAADMYHPEGKVARAK